MVNLGIDNIEKYSQHFEGKRIGLITNATGVNRNFESTVDILHRHFNLVKLFAPEHGVRGDLQAGITLEGYTDGATGLPVVSLYGANRRPTPEVLEDVDILAFDIQDVGSRFYTYLYTMAYAMEACAQNGKTCVVFDRPNPLNGVTVEGNILDLSCKSFIGLYPIPQRYGLTIGECAKLFNAEYGINCDLVVVPMTGWRRDAYFENTGIHWVLPSPNIPNIDSCFTFNCSCIFEGTNISEGRGTTKPFSFVGAPWLDSDKLAAELNSRKLPGVHFRPQYFTPLLYHPTLSKHAGELCSGVEIHVTDRAAFLPVRTGLHMLYAIKEMSGSQFKWAPPFTEKHRHMIDYNTGNTYVREGRNLDEILQIYGEDSKKFAEIKSKYHLY